MSELVHASIRVCEALTALRNEWNKYEEWSSSHTYYSKVLLPQLQSDLTQCRNTLEKSILLELKLIATAEEWANLPIIMADLDGQKQRALQAEKNHQQNSPTSGVPETIADIKIMLANHRFAEAEALYAANQNPSARIQLPCLTASIL